MQDEFDPRSEDRATQQAETPAAPPVFCWNYGQQSAYDMRVRPRRRRGALTFAIVMTLAFLISFGALAAVLITYPDAVKDRIPTSEEQMYEKPQQAAPVEEPAPVKKPRTRKAAPKAEGEEAPKKPRTRKAAPKAEGEEAPKKPRTRKTTKKAEEAK